MSELFDTHIHLNRLPAAELTKELKAAQRRGIKSFLIPGIFPFEWNDLLELAQKDSNIYLAPGLHPLAAKYWTPEIEEELKNLLTRPAVVAIGEIGLDDKIVVPMELQEKAFRGQLRLSVAAGLPLILHCRGRLSRALQIFREEQGPSVGGILHAFSGSLEIAREALRLNLILGFGGAITWPGARRAPEVLRALPSTSFVLESDAPDQSPEPHRRERNLPEWLELTAEECAELRNTSREEIAFQSTENARRLFNLNSKKNFLDKD